MNIFLCEMWVTLTLKTKRSLERIVSINYKKILEGVGKIWNMPRVFLKLEFIYFTSMVSKNLCVCTIVTWIYYILLKSALHAPYVNTLKRNAGGFSADLQFTWTCTSAHAWLRTPLVAVHRYVPAWLLLTSCNERGSPNVTFVDLSRNFHVIFGLGFPVELQNRMTSSVSLTVAFWEM